MHLYPLAGLQKGLSDPTLLGVLCPHSLTVSLHVQASCGDCTYSFYASSFQRATTSSRTQPSYTVHRHLLQQLVSYEILQHQVPRSSWAG